MLASCEDCIVEGDMLRDKAIKWFSRVTKEIVKIVRNSRTYEPDLTPRQLSRNQAK